MPGRSPSPDKPVVLVIVGPTASGKTALAVEAALAYGGEILSADSMQIYRGMDVGTAKPTKEEQQGVPHHLIDLVDPDEPFSVADWQQAAFAAIDGILGRGRLPIVAGGTGLYVNSLVHHLQFSQSGADEAFRQAMRALAGEKGVEAVHARLAELDPESASRIHPNNLVRVIRTLEVVSQTGEPMRVHLERSRTRPSPWRFVLVGLLPERDRLYQRINHRVERMLADGLEQEVRGLLAAGYAPNLQSMQGIGYKEMAAHLDGTLTIAEATALIQQGSRQYAKRQITWFSRLEGLCWLDPLGLDRAQLLARTKACLDSV